MRQNPLFKIVMILMIAFPSCGPDDINPCDLNSLNGKIFAGSVSLCNAILGMQVDFGAKAYTEVVGNNLIISVIDTVNFYSYSEIVEVTSQCIEGETNTFSHTFYDINSNLEVGKIHTKNSILFLNVNKIPCLQSIDFIGDIN